jgi:hypothetical protein
MGLRAAQSSVLSQYLFSVFLGHFILSHSGEKLISYFICNKELIG